MSSASASSSASESKSNAKSQSQSQPQPQSQGQPGVIYSNSPYGPSGPKIPAKFLKNPPPPTPPPPPKPKPPQVAQSSKFLTSPASAFPSPFDSQYPESKNRDAWIVVHSDPAVLKYLISSGTEYPEYLTRFQENKKIPSISPPEHPPIQLAYTYVKAYTQSGFCFMDSKSEEFEISLYRREDENEKKENEKRRINETDRDRKERERMEYEELWLEKAVESMKLGEKALFACFWPRQWVEWEKERERAREREKREKDRKERGLKPGDYPEFDDEDENWPPIDAPPPRFYWIQYLKVEREFNPDEVNEEDKYIYAETRKQRAKKCLELKQPSSALIQLNKGVKALEAISTLAVPVEAGSKIKESQASMYAFRSAVRSQLKDYIGAKEDCTKYLELEPKSLKLLFRRGESSRQLGEYFEAKRDFERIAQLWKERMEEKAEREKKEKEEKVKQNEAAAAVGDEAKKELTPEEKQAAEEALMSPEELEQRRLIQQLLDDGRPRLSAAEVAEQIRERELADEKIKELAEKHLKLTLEQEKKEQSKLGKRLGGLFSMLRGNSKDEEEELGDEEEEEKEFQRMRHRLRTARGEKVTLEQIQEEERLKKEKERLEEEKAAKEASEVEEMSFFTMLKEIILFLIKAWCGSSRKSVLEEEAKEDALNQAEAQANKAAEMEKEKKLKQLKEQQAKAGELNDKEKAE